MAPRPGITLVAASFPPNVVGGAEVNAKLLADYLHERGWDVAVVTGAALLPRVPYPIVSVPAFRPRPSLIYEPWWAKRTAQRIRSFFSQDRIIHSFDVLSRAVVAELQAQRAVATLQDVSTRCGDMSGVLTDGTLCPGCTPDNLARHSATVLNHQGIGRMARLIRYQASLPYRAQVLETYQSLTTVSQFLRQYLGLGQATVVPDIVLPLDPAQLPQTQGAPTVVSVGRLAFDKGTDLLLTALQELPEFLALLVGRGDSAYWRQQAEALGVAERVTFVGPVSHEEVAAWYGRGDIVVSASRAPEGSSRTVLEAMTLGKAIVAPNFGGTAELVTEGSTGRLFSRGDAASLARAVRRAYKERQTLGARALAASQLYLPHRVGPLYEALYASLS